MYLGHVAQRTPDKAAIIHLGEKETILTYRELDERSTRLARYLREQGLKAGDGIAVLAANHLDVPEIYWAGQRSGLHYTPVNTHLSVDEIRHVITDSGARTVFVSAANLDTAARALEGFDIMLVALDGTRQGFRDYETALASVTGAPLDGELEGTPFIYSSGTTGLPKGVKRPQSGNAPGGTLFGMAPSIAAAYGLTAESIALIPMPLYHSSGLTRLMLCTSMGCTTIISERFEATQALATIEKYRVTDSLWVATMFVRMLQLPTEVRDSFDLSSQVNVTVGSGPCPAHVKERMIEWWGPIITEIYGGTEGSGMTRITSSEWLTHRGSVGLPVFGAVHVVDDDGNAQPVGQDGTIYFSGGRPFEYHNPKPGSAPAYDERGWSTLGDVGHVDDDGYVYLTDRKSDMIIVGGVNISPAEIEATLIEHPAVRDVAVIGVPSEEYGEVVKAVVEPMDPSAAGDALADELLRFCVERLPKFKVPRSIDFEENLPRHPTGKLYKRLLRSRYWEGRPTNVV
jgi:long-chain acyl-CoA synthetase